MAQEKRPIDEEITVASSSNGQRRPPRISMQMAAVDVVSKTRTIRMLSRDEHCKMSKFDIMKDKLTFGLLRKTDVISTENLKKVHESSLML